MNARITEALQTILASPTGPSTMPHAAKPSKASRMPDLDKLISELRDGLVDVTPGPWHVHSEPEVGMFGDVVAGTLFEGLTPIWNNSRNLEHIARCDPENIRALLAELDRLRTENQNLREGLSPFAESYIAECVDETGWTGNIHREPISAWFGPSDFRSARALSNRTQEDRADG